MSETRPIIELMFDQQDAMARGSVRRELEQRPRRPVTPPAQKIFDLANLANYVPVALPGFALIYRRGGQSSPAGRVTVNMGGEFQNLEPGDRLDGYFEGFQVKRGDDSAAVGKAELVIITDRDADFIEPIEKNVPSADAAKLLGNVDTGTFVTLAEDTQPSGTPANQFDTTGWKKIRVYVDGQAANTMTSADFIPWNKDAASRWNEQGEAMKSIPDSASSGYRYRSFVFELEPKSGVMAFELRNLLPAGQTQVGIIVEGIE